MKNNNLTDMQKGLTVIFASIIMDESPSSNTLLANIMDELNISEFELDRNVKVLQTIIDLQGERSLQKLKNISHDDKILIRSIFDKALRLGGLSNDSGTIMTYSEILNQAGLTQITGTTIRTSLSLNICLDSSVKSISRTAACHLSSVIANGIMLAQNNDVVIYKDRIDFGRCSNPEIQGMSGNIAPNFYMEYGNVIYRFGSNLKCGWFNKQIDYVGTMAPTFPDNPEIFNLIYPHFA